MYCRYYITANFCLVSALAVKKKKLYKYPVLITHFDSIQSYILFIWGIYIQSMISTAYTTSSQPIIFISFFVYPMTQIPQPCLQNILFSISFRRLNKPLVVSKKHGPKTNCL